MDNSKRCQVKRWRRRIKLMIGLKYVFSVTIKHRILFWKFRILLESDLMSKKFRIFLKFLFLSKMIQDFYSMFCSLKIRIRAIEIPGSPSHPKHCYILGCSYVVLYALGPGGYTEAGTSHTKPYTCVSGIWNYVFIYAEVLHKRVCKKRKKNIGKNNNVREIFTRKVLIKRIKKWKHVYN